ncbi:Putative serine protease HtrA [Paraconexibacter sp. AEG42_29]|uniref:S1C family serine protease n=1 Tax=Paraconexibacter sp. AEG42_29 TaxID=2997339 RepID=UPI00339D6033
MKKLVPVVGAAVLGGVVAATGVALLDLGATSTTRTVVQQAPLSADTGSSRLPAGGAMTARDLYKRDSPGVVFVRADVVQQGEPSPFDFGSPQAQRGLSTGSGFVIDARGDILTNAHVVDGAVKVTVQLADKQVVDARVIGKDVDSDIALLRVDPDGLNLMPLQLGSAKDVQVGDPVIAIGNPFGLDRTLTTGVVSALQRRISAPNKVGIDNVIQTDAAINPGNSGGPLIDATGRVIGINSQIETGGSGNGSVGIGFAVPIDTAKEILPQLKTGAKVQRAYLGVSSLTVDGSLAALRLPTRAGVLVQTVQAGSPAAKAGIHAGTQSAQLGGIDLVLGGDILQSVDGKAITSSEDLTDSITGHKPGDTVRIGLLRGREKLNVTVELATRPDAADIG